MALSSTNALNELVYALGANASRLVIDKASIANRGGGGVSKPLAGHRPAGAGRNPNCGRCVRARPGGSFSFTQQTAPMTSYIGYLEAVCQNSSVSLEVHDRLMHEGGMNGTLTTAQTSGVNLNARHGQQHGRAHRRCQLQRRSMVARVVRRHWRHCFQRDRERHL